MAVDADATEPEMMTQPHTSARRDCVRDATCAI